MTAPITLTVRITNAYPELGREFTHDEVVTVDAPAAETMADPDGLADWAQDQLIEYSGEGPEYADTHGVYEVAVTAAPAGYGTLVGLEAYAEG
ncbi:hypothetical protein [Gordonia sihwensis]|uniref:hypothetical protein n=1 Tax=Gordonia sihwensis TaxID=173559 RepID=UPI0005EE4C53|nr:hypothetical protein [Gordonia sihwensis]KJR05977.1 hypothetical protein UG54_15000 [Gordonia sihwensis]